MSKRVNCGSNPFRPFILEIVSKNSSVEAVLLTYARTHARTHARAHERTHAIHREREREREKAKMRNVTTIIKIKNKNVSSFVSSSTAQMFTTLSRTKCLCAQVFVFLSLHSDAVSPPPEQGEHALIGSDHEVQPRDASFPTAKQRGQVLVPRFQRPVNRTSPPQDSKHGYACGPLTTDMSSEVLLNTWASANTAPSEVLLNTWESANTTLSEVLLNTWESANTTLSEVLLNTWESANTTLSEVLLNT